MSVPHGFYELARHRDLDLGTFDVNVSRPEWPVFVRFVPVRESTAKATCNRLDLPCGADEWFHYYPRTALYAGPVTNQQVPLVVAITRAAVNVQWPLEPICQTWGAGAGSCHVDQWLLPYEVVPIAPPSIHPWPYAQATWTKVREQTPPLGHRLIAAAPPEPFELQPVHPQEIAQR